MVYIPGSSRTDTKPGGQGIAVVACAKKERISFGFN